MEVRRVRLTSRQDPSKDFNIPLRLKIPNKTLLCLDKPQTVGCRMISALPECSEE